MTRVSTLPLVLVYSWASFYILISKFKLIVFACSCNYLFLFPEIATQKRAGQQLFQSPLVRARTTRFHELADNSSCHLIFKPRVL